MSYHQTADLLGFDPNTETVGHVLDSLRDATSWLETHAAGIPDVRVTTVGQRLLELHPADYEDFERCVTWLALNDHAWLSTTQEALMNAAVDGPGFSWIAGDYFVEHDTFSVAVVRTWGALSVAVVITHEALS